MAGFASKVAASLNKLFGTQLGGKAGDSAGPTSSGSEGKMPPLAHGSEPRRYKRANLLVGGASGLSGIQLQIASASAQFRGKPYPVVDLSHTGIAVQREDLKDSELPDGSKVESMVMALGLLDPFPVQVTMVRHSGKVLAFEFVNVSTDARLAIDKFLDPKMIGLNMRAVDRSFFSPGETFSLWYCGPRDTNFFLWMNGSKLDRSIIQLGDDQFALAPSNVSGVRFVRQTQTPGKIEDSSELRESILFSLDVALQVREGGAAIQGLVKLLTEAADTLPTEPSASSPRT